MRQSQAGRAATQDVGSPQLIQAMIEAMRIPDLRGKILFTLAMLVVFRFVAQVPIPGVNVQALSQAFAQDGLLGFLNLFSGGALINLSVAALGVYPYITSSIVMQILTPVVPQLKALSQEGEFGRQRINQYTHYLAVPVAVFQGFGQLTLFQTQYAVFPDTNLGLNITTLAMIASMVAGTMFLVWLGELITEKGIGNGISLIIFGGIVAGLPQLIGQGFLESDEGAGLLMLVVLVFATLYTIVLFNEAQRRIPVQYGRSVFRGGRMQRQSGSTFLPLRVNSAGMIPLIFSYSVIFLPVTVAGYFRDPLSTSIIVRGLQTFADAMDTTRVLFWVVLFFLTLGFAFFYTLVTFQQQNLAENLQKNGGFIPGIRPGQPTQEYLNRVIIRITWGGALFLATVAVLPFVFQIITDIRAVALSSASLLIMVGVALDTMRQLEAQLLMRNYEGFLR